MGTNYYVKMKACPHCGRGGEDLHIGKSSGGWKFLFQRHDDMGLDSARIWFDFLAAPDRIIVDEYGQNVAFDDFKSLVERKQDDRLTGLNCARLCGCSEWCRTHKSDETIDDDGYRIANGREFF